MKLELLRKDVHKIHNDCDSHITVTYLINKLEVALKRHFDLLTDGVFDEIRSEIFLNEQGVDEIKYVMVKR